MLRKKLFIDCRGGGQNFYLQWYQKHTWSILRFILFINQQSGEWKVGSITHHKTSYSQMLAG